MNFFSRLFGKNKNKGGKSKDSPEQDDPEKLDQERAKAIEERAKAIALERAKSAPQPRATTPAKSNPKAETAPRAVTPKPSSVASRAPTPPAASQPSNKAPPQKPAQPKSAPAPVQRKPTPSPAQRKPVEASKPEAPRKVDPRTATPRPKAPQAGTPKPKASQTAAAQQPRRTTERQPTPPPPSSSKANPAKPHQAAADLSPASSSALKREETTDRINRSKPQAPKSAISRSTTVPRGKIEPTASQPSKPAPNGIPKANTPKPARVDGPAFKPVSQTRPKAPSRPSAPASSPSAPAAPKAAPAAAKSSEGGQGEDLLSDVIGSLEQSFDAIIGDALPSDAETPAAETGASGRKAQPRTDSEFDRLTILELFYDIAANHVKPVRNFIMELHDGEVRKEWLQIVQSAIRSIHEAAKQIDIPDLNKALDDYEAVLAIASETPGDVISGEVRDEIIDQYQNLTDVLPKAFTLKDERDQRESLIVHSLLKQVPDVRKVTMDKLYSAGLTALEVLFLATTEDLAATTGIRQVLAQRIVDKFQHYRVEKKQAIPDSERLPFRNKLQSLLEALRTYQQKYEKATKQRDSKGKRAQRLARQGTMLDITIILAQLGELQLIEELERLPFDKRIDKLENYLQAK